MKSEKKQRERKREHIGDKIRKSFFQWNTQRDKGTRLLQ